MTIWFDPGLSWEGAPAGKCGRRRLYSDAAIQSCLTMTGDGRPEVRPVDGFQP